MPIETASQYVSKAGETLVAKMAGTGVSAGLYGLVSTYGVASTGTAIVTLSGAAESSATFYAVGSLVGGGAATGAVLTGGLGVAASLLMYKYLNSSPRKEDSMTKVDKRTIEVATFLVAQIDKELDRDRVVMDREMAVYFNSVLEPFFNYVESNEEDISSRLDFQNRLAFKATALVDFKREVIKPFKKYAAHISE